MAAFVFAFLGVVAASTAWTWPPSSLERAKPVGEPRFCSGAGQLCFSYNRKSYIGPPKWYNVCQTRDCFFGKNQSPIYINPYRVNYNCGPRLGYYDNPNVSGHLRNEGIYPQANNIEGEAKLSGVPGFPSKKFILNAVHIHFRGGADNRGTEHQIGFKDYDAEMHMVHRREDVSKDDLDEQNHVESGRTVVGVFLSTTQGRRSKELDRILRNIGKVWEYRLNLCRKFFKKCPRRIYGEDYFKIYNIDDNGNGNDSDNGNSNGNGNGNGNENGNGNKNGYGNGNGDGNGNGNGNDNGYGNGNGESGNSDESGEYDDDDLHEFCRKFYSKPLRCLEEEEIEEGEIDNGNGEGIRNGYGKGKGKENGSGNGYGNGYDNGMDNGENGDNGENDYEECDYDDDNGECPDIADPTCLDDECGEIAIEFHPDGLLPKRRDFYYYYGSLTSPPVSEVVAWEIMAEPIRITKLQLWLMKQMESRKKGVKIVKYGNVRPLQKLNGRKVYGNFCSLFG